jgi:hypothetical protein
MGRLLRRYGFELLQINPIQFFIGDWSGGPLRPLAGLAGRSPEPIARFLAAAASRSINIVCRKTA